MLYLHIPYCHRKCSYCAFYSVVTSERRDAYIDALCCEIDQRGDGRSLRTIYFGGGTPSMLYPDELGRIVDAISRNFDISIVEEVTLEANPEDLTQEFLSELSKNGFFNRLSIGVQSFDNRDLHIINRRHDAQQATEAVINAAKAGFDNVSIDLIMGLPGQTEETFENNLHQLGSLLCFGNIKHLSCYELSVEPGTILERQIEMGRLQLADDELLAREYKMIRDWCAEHGFEQYEVSNFSLQGFRSRHNSRYWNRTPYLGVGAGAHSFDGRCRRWNLSDVELYSRSETAPFEEELLTAEDAFNEYVMTSLRTVEGIDKNILNMLFPSGNYTAWLSKVNRFVDSGLLVDTATHLLPTPEGLLHADGISASLFL